MRHDRVEGTDHCDVVVVGGRVAGSLAAILFAAMRNGATRMQFLTQIPVDIISVIQALILLFVAADAIVRYIYRIRKTGDKVVLTRGWGG